MIKKYFSLLVLSLFILFSCTTENNQLDDTNNNISKAKIDNVLEMEADVQRLAYGSLNSYEKYFIWNTRLDQIKVSMIDKDKISLINELQELLSLEYFKNSDIREQNYKIFSALKVRVIEVFGYEMSRKYFTSLENINIDDLTTNLLSKNDSGIGFVPICNCNSGDDWCIWGSNCFAGFCEQTTSGCGWWLSQPCHGQCATN